MSRRLAEPRSFAARSFAAARSHARACPPAAARGLAVLVLCLGSLASGALAGRAAAADGSSLPGAALEPPPDTMSDFWREVRRPGYARSRTLLRHALRQLEEAMSAPSPYRRAANLESAITRLQLAHTRAPDDAEVLYYLSLAVSQWEAPSPDGRVRRRNREAIALFHQLRALDADFRAQAVAFELGVLYTRVGELASAVAEYERGIAVSFTESETATAHSNLAEVTMLGGDLPSSIAHYERAVAISRSGGPAQATSLVLALWGLSVALDRYGDRTAALERAREAFSTGGAGTSVLRSEGVFFEPVYEIHYYEGLGALAALSMANDAAERRRTLRDALRSFHRYLGEGGQDGPFRAAAEARVADIEALLRAEDRRRQ